jgi:hypothetical protein
MSHLRSADGTILREHDPSGEGEQHVEAASRQHDHLHHGHARDGHHHAQHKHGGLDHSPGLVDRSVLRSRAGVRAVALGLLILGVAAGAQLAIFALASSLALLADLIHNFGDALTAITLGIAFLLRSVRGADSIVRSLAGRATPTKRPGWRVRFEESLSLGRREGRKLRGIPLLYTAPETAAHMR